MTHNKARKDTWFQSGRFGRFLFSSDVTGSTRLELSVERVEQEVEQGSGTITAGAFCPFHDVLEPKSAKSKLKPVLSSSLASTTLGPRVFVVVAGVDDDDEDCDDDDR